MQQDTAGYRAGRGLCCDVLNNIQTDFSLQNKPAQAVMWLIKIESESTLLNRVNWSPLLCLADPKTAALKHFVHL